MAHSLRVVACSLLAVLSRTGHAQECRPYWSALAPNNPIIHAGDVIDKRIANFDDGTGLTIYAANTASQGQMYRWQNAAWESLPVTGLSIAQGPAGFLVLDDGQGPALYLQQGTLEIFRWNGNGWTRAHPKLFASSVGPLMSYDLGVGSRIYGQGQYVGLSVSSLVRWDGGQWSVCGHTDAYSLSPVGMTDATGPAIYMFGFFKQVDDIRCRGFARWDGTRWTCPSPSVVVQVSTPTVFDDGSGPGIFVVGNLYPPGEPGGLWRWRNNQWTLIGRPSAAPGQVVTIEALHVFDDGRGPALYIGGSFDAFAGVPAKNIIRYSAAGLEALPFSGVRGSWLGTVDDVRGRSLIIVRNLDLPTTVGGGVVDQAVLWTGCATPQCYADCNRDRLVNVSDLICYMTAFAQRDPYANCTVDATIDVADFVCYQTKFAAGCGR